MQGTISIPQIVIPPAAMPPKVVREIPATINIHKEIMKSYRQLRVCAYCRVSTKQEEQLNSYEVQVKHYTERINKESKWTLVGIFADKGITGMEKANASGVFVNNILEQNNLKFIVSKDIASTVDEWKAWLAEQLLCGTPLTLYYILKTPQTSGYFISTDVSYEPLKVKTMPKYTRIIQTPLTNKLGYGLEKCIKTEY